MLSDEQRGTGNGIQISAGYLGNLIGGGLCVIVYDRYVWIAAVTLLAALTAVGLVTIKVFREDERAERVADTAQAYRALFSVFAQPCCRRWTFAVVPLLYVGSDPLAIGITLIPWALAVTLIVILMGRKR